MSNKYQTHIKLQKEKLGEITCWSKEASMDPDASLDTCAHIVHGVVLEGVQPALFDELQLFRN